MKGEDVLNEIRFTVYGVAAGKGSATSFFSAKQGRTFTHSPKSTQSWERLVRVIAQEHVPAGGLVDGPVEMGLRFFLPKPKSAPKRRRTWPDRKPDLDKLVRAVLDALTGVIYTDDARVVRFEELSKDYGDPPRVEIVIRTIEEGVAGERARVSGGTDVRGLPEVRQETLSLFENPGQG